VIHQNKEISLNKNMGLSWSAFFLIVILGMIDRRACGLCTNCDESEPQPDSLDAYTHPQYLGQSCAQVQESGCVPKPQRCVC
jgi:hypothetical protein